MTAKKTTKKKIGNRYTYGMIGRNYQPFGQTTIDAVLKEVHADIGISEGEELVIYELVPRAHYRYGGWQQVSK